MGDRQTLVCMLCPNNSSIFFVRTVINQGGPPAHSNSFFQNGRNRIQAEVELNQKLQGRLWSPRLQMGFDMVTQSVYFPFSKLSFPSKIFFSRDPNIRRPFHGLSGKQRNPIRGRPKLSASLWKAWSHRNAVDLMTSTDS
jgi:hypothetical protein